MKELYAEIEQTLGVDYIVESQNKIGENIFSVFHNRQGTEYLIMKNFSSLSSMMTSIGDVINWINNNG